MESTIPPTQEPKNLRSGIRIQCASPTNLTSNVYTVIAYGRFEEALRLAAR